MYCFIWKASLTHVYYQIIISLIFSRERISNTLHHIEWAINGIFNNFYSQKIFNETQTTARLKLLNSAD